ncbi:MAG: tetratricopeptide repeat protein [Pirellulaceae bacterium]
MEKQGHESLSITERPGAESSRGAPPGWRVWRWLGWITVGLLIAYLVIAIAFALRPEATNVGELPEGRRDASPLQSLDPAAGESSPATVPLQAAAKGEGQLTADSTPIPDTVSALYREAEAEAQRILKRFPEQTDAQEVMARVKLLLGQASAATRHWEDALRLNPNYSYAYDGLASVATKRGDDEEAIRLYRKSLAIVPNSSQSWLELSRILVKLGRLDEARDALMTDVKLEPRSFDGHLLLGQVLFQLEDYVGSKAQYLQAAAIAPEQPKPYYGLGMACQRLNQVEESREYLAKNTRLRAQATQAADLNVIFSDLGAACRDVAKVYTTMGQLYGALKSPADAERLLRRAGQLDKTNTQSQLQLSVFLLQAGRQDDALTVVKQLADMAIANPYHYLEVAVLYARLRRLDEAESMLAKCRELAPGETWAFRESARFYLHVRRNPAEALRWARQAVELDPTAEDYAILGDACLRNGDNPGAAAALRRALELDPQNPSYARSLKLIESPS